MEGAKVGIFEDSDTWQGILTRIVERGGHEVQLTATTMEEARAALAELTPGLLDVAIVDGNLDEDSFSGDDGREITAQLHEIGGVVVIGFSGSREVDGADYTVRKSGDPRTEIPEIIDNL